MCTNMLSYAARTQRSFTASSKTPLARSLSLFNYSFGKAVKTARKLHLEKRLKPLAVGNRSMLIINIKKPIRRQAVSALVILAFLRSDPSLKLRQSFRHGADEKHAGNENYEGDEVYEDYKRNEGQD